MQQKGTMDRDVGLIDYIDVITRRKKIILSIFLIPTIATAIVSFMLPETYKAEGVIQMASDAVPFFYGQESRGIVRRVYIKPLFSEEEAKQIIPGGSPTRPEIDPGIAFS